MDLDDDTKVTTNGNDLVSVVSQNSGNIVFVAGTSNIQLNSWGNTKYFQSFANWYVVSDASSPNEVPCDENFEFTFMFLFEVAPTHNQDRILFDDNCFIDALWIASSRLLYFRMESTNYVTTVLVPSDSPCLLKFEKISSSTITVSCEELSSGTIQSENIVLPLPGGPSVNNANHVIQWGTAQTGILHLRIGSAIYLLGRDSTQISSSESYLKENILVKGHRQTQIGL